MTSSWEPSTCTVMYSSKLPIRSALRLISNGWYPSTSIRPVDGCTSTNLLNTVSGRRTWNTAGMRPRLARTTSYWWDVLVKIDPVSSVSSDSWTHAGSPSAQIVSGSRVSRPVTSQNTNYTVTSTDTITDMLTTIYSFNLYVTSHTNTNNSPRWLDLGYNEMP